MYRTSDLLNYTFGHAPRGLEDAAVAPHLLPIAIAKVAIPGPIPALEALSTLHPTPHTPPRPPDKSFSKKLPAQRKLRQSSNIFSVFLLFGSSSW